MCHRTETQQWAKTSWAETSPITKRTKFCLGLGRTVKGKKNLMVYTGELDGSLLSRGLVLPHAKEMQDRQHVLSVSIQASFCELGSLPLPNLLLTSLLLLFWIFFCAHLLTERRLNMSGSQVLPSPWLIRFKSPRNSNSPVASLSLLTVAACPVPTKRPASLTKFPYSLITASPFPFLKRYSQSHLLVSTPTTSRYSMHTVQCLDQLLYIIPEVFLICIGGGRARST
ncbi:hypothetical protein BGZ63DRAFT_5709 [Mariannaea sp. PMI_226]|nr:hypothetical protein BGZ63DRAFT_5709 [Mariannaea sp. PMI_226]